MKSAIYAAADLITRGRGISRNINGEEIRFPARWARYYESDYEVATFDFLRSVTRPGDYAIDLGAHLGLFTVLMSRLSGSKGSVHSLEPAPTTYHALQNVIRINGCTNVVAEQAAASGEEGFITFSSDGVSNANHIVMNGNESGVTVRATTIDALAGDRSPAVIKVDVEGAELDVLRAGEKTIRRSTPFISLALHPPVLADGVLAEIADVIASYGLEAWNDGKVRDRAWITERTDLCDLQLRPA